MHPDAGATTRTAPEERFVAWLQHEGQRLSAIARRHPIRVDLAVACAIVAASMIGLAVQGRLHHVDTIVFCVALCLPLLLRSVTVRWSFGLVAAVAFVQWLTSTPQIADGAVLVALFWVALDGELSDIVLAALTAQAGAVMAALRWSPREPIKTLVGVTGLVVAAAALGLALRERRSLVASLQERAARLELERDQQRQAAAAAERARIARELHDIVAHNLAVMIGLADGAAYAFESTPGQSLTAIERVAATGREALAEMRRLLGVLRDGPETGSLEPQPDLERLDDLLARVQAAGIPVSIATEGDLGGLSRGVQLTVFRVAQEALTNTLRHAGRPASAQITLRHSGDLVELDVVNSGAAATAPTVIGRGLRGMEERAAAYGGTLDAGPGTAGGWHVRLVIPASEGTGR